VAKVIWSLQALEDVSEIGLFFERDSSQFAEVIVNRLYYSTERLVEFPKSERIVPELDDPNTRELIVSGYRIVYELSRVSAIVLAVLHGRQDIRKKLSS
jgi:toxin ParE1/3/4